MYDNVWNITCVGHRYCTGLGKGDILASETFWLNRLAHHQHIITHYRDWTGVRQRATPDQILGILQAMDIPISRIQDAQPILRDLEASRLQHGTPSVVVASTKAETTITLSLPVSCTRVTYTIVDEWGDSHGGSFSPQAQPSAPVHRHHTRRSRFYWTCPPLSIGYHTVHWDYSGQTSTTLLIVPPSQEPMTQTREWGLFFPLYGLISPTNWGAGNFGDLGRLAQWGRQWGAQFVGTLPLLPTFLNELYDPSPYRPVSHLFWNEFFLDVEHLLKEYPGTFNDSFIGSRQFQRELTALRQSASVDYRRGMALRRKVLERLLPHTLSASHKEWLTSHPEVQQYARFRAAVEKRRTSWTTWDPKDPLPEGNCEASRYHQFVQWQADLALKQFAQKEASDGGGLYLDLPVGVHPDGYDAWRYRELFAHQASVGAPPDTFFRSGQNWGFPPLDPDRLRTNHYQYFIQTLRHHLRYAKILRLDHVMGFYRKFWIPRSGRVEDGLYVRYPAEEFYAIIDVESRRSHTTIVGENLGLVPKAVDAALHRHHYLGTWIFPTTTDPPPEDTLAVLATHDMAPWATFWATATDQQRRMLKRLVDVNDPNPTAKSMLGPILEALFKSPSRLVMVNLEDLYGETLPVNVPGTSTDQNWTRKMRRTWQDILNEPEIQAFLPIMARKR